jgi:hypothetical protein
MKFTNASKLDRKSGVRFGERGVARVYRSVKGLTGSRIQAVMAK